MANRLAFLVASFIGIGARVARAEPAATSTPGTTFDPPRASSHVEWATPFTADRVSMSLGPGFGSSDLNLGFGARAGYTVGPGVYFGALGDYWFGKSFGGEATPTPPGGGITGSARAWDVFGNVGYDLAPSETLVLRPFVGYGILGSLGEMCLQTCESSRESKQAGLVGSELLFDLDGLTVGGDLRVLFAGDVIVVAAFGAGAVF
jgi:hypothetical protein